MHGPAATVVIPSSRGAAALSETLDSLAEQTLPRSRFEVVVAVNGAATRDRSGLDLLRRRYRGIDLRLIISSSAGASWAWNLGVQAARTEWLTFLDDDDRVEPRFLETLLGSASPGVVPVTEIVDVHPDRTIDRDTPLNTRIRASAGRIVTANELPQILGFNACKLIPTRWAKEVRYDPALANGQDIVYFGSIAARHDVKFSIADDGIEAAYLRFVSPTSMSNQAMTYTFCVSERLAVIERLAALRVRAPSRRRTALTHLIAAQAHLMNRYLRAHPDQRRRVLDDVKRRCISQFPYSSLNRDLSTRLIISASARDTTVLDEWLASVDEPVDVLLVGGAPPPARSELVGRVRSAASPRRRDRVRAIARVVEQAPVADPPHREVVTATRGLARAFGAAISAQRTATRHVVLARNDGRRRTGKHT